MTPERLRQIEELYHEARERNVRPFPGGAPSGSGKWQISTGGGAHPIWSRNGRELPASRRDRST